MPQEAARVTGGRRVARGRVADQIVTDLRERILSGELPDGSRLPSERELAAEYEVSGSTIREAIRVMATTGLLSVRHGAGTFVTASADTLLGLSIASVVRLEGIGARDVLGMLAALNRFAVRLATQEASDAEVASLREAVENMAVIDDSDSAAENLRVFMWRLAEASHNALLIPVCRLLSDVQVALACAITGGRLSVWRRIMGGLHTERIAIVEAIENRSADQAAEAVDAHSAQAVKLILSSSEAKRLQASDPGYVKLLAQVLGAKLNASAD